MDEQIQYGVLDLSIKNNLDKFDKSTTNYYVLIIAYFIVNYLP